MNATSNFKRKVYLQAAILGGIFLTFALGSSLLGKFLDNKYNAYPKYSLTFFGISFIVSWVIVIIVLRKSKVDKKDAHAQSGSNNTH